MKEQDMQKYEVSSLSKAELDEVFSLLLRGYTWPRWMGVDSVAIETANGSREPAMEGEKVGDVRIIRTGRYTNREQIVEALPNRRFRYVILDGMFSEYEGLVQLTPGEARGTLITWSGTFRMKIPGAAWLMKLYLQRFMKRAIENLALLAEGSTPRAQERS
jgi:hypothetical protein